MGKLKKYQIPLKNGISTVFWLAAWQLAAKTVPENLAVFLPGPFAVFRAFCKLLPQPVFMQAVGATLLRIFFGLATGCLTGFALGVLTSQFSAVDTVFSPLLRIIRAVPVVSFIILAFLFISSDRLPAFIAFLMVTPLLWQTAHDGLRSADLRLLEMAKVYRLSRFRTLVEIRLPLVASQILSAVVSAVGLAWKSGVAAEVICTPAVSLGKAIYRAKGSLAFDEVYAVTLVVVLLSLFLEKTVKWIWTKLTVGEKGVR